MQRITKEILISISLLIIFFASISYLAGNWHIKKHEEVHAQFCKYFGGIPTTTFSDFGLRGKVICDLGGMSDEDDRLRKVMDSVNEMIGYQLQPFFFIIIVFSFFISLLLIILLIVMTERWG